MQRVVKCDKCKKDFIQKYINYKKQWSQLNEIKFWIGEQKEWNGYRYFCRSCLKKWPEFSREKFENLVLPDKKKLFFDYKYRGTLDQNDRVNRANR